MSHGGGAWACPARHQAKSHRDIGSEMGRAENKTLVGAECVAFGGDVIDRRRERRDALQATAFTACAAARGERAR